MSAIIFDGVKEAEKIKASLTARIKKLVPKPGLAFLMVGDNPASRAYVARKEELGKALGVNIFRADLGEGDYEKARKQIDQWNEDDGVTGILIQLPLPKSWPAQELINTISILKDVDGLTSFNQARLYGGAECTVPATPRAVMEILKIMKAPVEHKHAVVIGRSLLVGKPTAHLLLQAGASVTIVHRQSWHTDRLTNTADIIVSAAGVPNLVKPNMVKKGATVIDVGITHVPRSLRGAKRRGNLVGDVSLKVAEVAGRLTPVPSGVGPMTVVMLYANLLDLAEKKE